MTYTFSLRRLMIGVTVLCAFCALVAAFPGATYMVIWAAGLFAPTIVACAVLPWFSSRPLLTAAVAVAGAILAYLASPTMYVSWAGMPGWWDLYSLDFQTKALPAAGGAFFAGFACVGIFPRWMKSRRETEAPGS
jgi:hypothetical protein